LWDIYCSATTFYFKYAQGFILSDGAYCGIYIYIYIFFSYLLPNSASDGKFYIVYFVHNDEVNNSCNTSKCTIL